MAAVFLCAATTIAAAQEDGPQRQAEKEQDKSRRKLEWVAPLAGRLRQLRDPVVVTDSLARLGGLLCETDPQTGADLYRDALSGLRLLTPTAFTSARHRLPVASFTALWKSVSAGAAKCAPELAQAEDAERAKAKMLEERQQANDNLRKAFAQVADDPDHAAQLAETALSASDPTLLDIPMLTLLLSRLRERAPDVADELFPEALDFIASTTTPSPGLLLELGKYLFTSAKYLETPDELQGSETFQVGGASIANFSINRKSTSSDDVHRYIEAALKVLTATNDPYYDPVAAYAIAYQLLPKADDEAPDVTDRLRDALNQVAALAGSSAAQVVAGLSASLGADPEGGEGPRLRDRWVGKVLASAAAQHFGEARDLAVRVDDLSIRGQLKVLIDFAEAAAAIGKRDIQFGFSMANTLRGGIKRSLLYAGLAVAAENRDEAHGYLQLGFIDLKPLPAEQRMMTLTALASGVLKKDPESGLLAVGMYVTAANDAYVSPHRGRFEPQVVRRHSRGATTADDSALVLVNRRCICEAVDTGRGRHYFSLKAPGVRSLQFADLLRNAHRTDVERLQAIILGLRDEALQSAALIALAGAQLAP